MTDDATPARRASSGARIPRNPGESRDERAFLHAADSGGTAYETLDLYRLLVASVRDYAIFALDRSGHVLSWNEGAARIKGYAAHEIIGRHFSTFYQEDDVAARLPDMELEVAAAEGRFEGEGWRVRKDGSLFWANVVITPLRDEHGELVGFGKVTRDLTERRAAHERFIADARRLAAEEAARTAAEESAR